ncbi:Coatomer, gamma subunit [Neocallimastix californiae]|jgi:coatomer protein complex subunit gamma|uniref:Coatomer subunit gamma n=1 Tax=Neocallimastix californiae TaxID=1754190 RepID=A0A1Y2DZ45_9FUNG|nr:Coatomer, gamma subunit [Neocallimastix californiae]|eukprot:ORY64580.1 Coatomer, gamma subunit [Neocallimastix californiae]
MMMQKKDEDTDGDMFQRIDKSTVLQEARAFNEYPINPKKCQQILTKILYLLAHSEVFATAEATETFFSITKLFQSKDIPLRQMVYLTIKELSSIAEDVIMVTSSLVKDINSTSETIYRANAIRALCKITDSSMLQSIERFLKQAIVDRNPSVASAALVSSHHLFNKNKEVVKRWINEVQEASNSRGLATQYHAIGLMYLIKQHDRMAVIKMIQNYSSGLRSPYAYCMLVRYIAKILDEEDIDGNARGLYEILEGFLRHKNDMIVYEAARSICNMKNVTSKELYPAVSALQLMLVSPKIPLRFAAIRTLNKLSLTHPQAIVSCNLDIENLITDSNRSIATFAITTLLKTGNEASVDRLMKQISGFMSEIADEFKIIVVDAIRALCLKFPQKQTMMLNFLASILRDEGGYEYKKAIVDAIFDIVQSIPESREFAFSYLCEFIEDCEFTKLSVRILHLLGSEGPEVSQPSQYIRYIYNRIILENSTIRAAATSALAKFAIKIPELRERIKVLLTRCLEDVDDEVRDRASLYLRILDNEELCQKYIVNENTYSMNYLESSLQEYMEDEALRKTAFDISKIPIITKAQEKSEQLRIKTKTAGMLASSAMSSAKDPSPKKSAMAESIDPQQQYAMEMEAIPQLAALGKLFTSSALTPLTELETEYVVGCVKHIFQEAIVFQFNCRNTLNDSVLENVSIVMDIASQDDENIDLLQPMFCIPCNQLLYDQPEKIYVVYKRPPQYTPSVTFSCLLKFIVKDCDPSTGEIDPEGYEDEYQLEDLDLIIGDYVAPAFIINFQKAWDEIGDANEVVETYMLTAATSIKKAINSVVDMLGMTPCENSDIVEDKASTHALLLTGTFVGGIPCIARARMIYESSTGVTLELTVRSPVRAVCEILSNAIN